MRRRAPTEATGATEYWFLASADDLEALLRDQVTMEVRAKALRLLKRDRHESPEMYQARLSELTEKGGPA